MTGTSLLRRRDAVARLLSERRDAVVVSGLGSATYDVAAAGDHERNFYLWGAMGGAAMVGLGLALSRASVPVIVITGDGEMLMAVGAFATIALQAPKNLSVIVLDNGRYGETGDQLSHTSRGTDLSLVAKGAGIDDARTIRTEDELARLAGRIGLVGEGPTVGVLKICHSEEARVIPLREGAHNKARLRIALALPPD